MATNSAQKPSTRHDCTRVAMAQHGPRPGGPRAVAALQKGPQAFRYYYNYYVHYSYRHRFYKQVPELSRLHNRVVPDATACDGAVTISKPRLRWPPARVSGDL